jgi:transcriptional regulator with XRE-family HTH domain
MKKVWECTAGELRKALAIPQQDVAEAIGITNVMLSMIEHGGSLSMKLAWKIARFYGRTIDELWTLLED